MATGKGAGQSNRHTSYLFLFFSPRWEISDSSQCRFSCPFKQLHPHGPESMACKYWETLSPTIPHSHPNESRVPSGSACCNLQYHGPISVHETLGMLKAQIKDLCLRCLPPCLLSPLAKPVYWNRTLHHFGDNTFTTPHPPGEWEVALFLFRSRAPALSV